MPTASLPSDVDPRAGREVPPSRCRYAGTAEAVDQMVSDALARGPDAVVEIDLRGIEHLGAQAVAVLVEARFVAHTQGRRLRILHSDGQPRWYLTTCGLLDSLPLPGRIAQAPSQERGTPIADRQPSRSWPTAWRSIMAAARAAVARSAPGR